MHQWGEENFDWKGLDDAILFIAINLKRWGRISVRQAKEKFGTARIYCSLGWLQFHCITHPGYVFSRYPNWLWHLDCDYGTKIVKIINYLVYPYHKWLYREVYKHAVAKWPHLKEEILCAADFDELLKGL
jgi:hypothetical protein